MKNLKNFLKSILGKKFFDIIYTTYLMIINPKKEIPNLVLKSKFYVKDDNNKTLFSIRLLGGSTFDRGNLFYESEPETVNWIKNFNKNSVFFDIGANIGLYSLYSAKLNHRVISFEPESLNFAALNLNITDNNFQEKIICYPIALDNSFLISKLKISKFRFGSSGHTFHDNSKNYSHEERDFLQSQGSISVSLDHFSESQNIYPDYIKIDVDGNELKVINGMKNLLKSKKIKSILIEIDKKIHDHRLVKEIIESNSYRLDYFAQKRKGANNHIFNLI